MSQTHDVYCGHIQPQIHTDLDFLWYDSQPQLTECVGPKWDVFASGGGLLDAIHGNLSLLLLLLLLCSVVGPVVTLLVRAFLLN